ncbi:hypothetical protein BDZ85DRAFT_260381 [Elsinoe ampelina]|uniref:non-specific serine/threonine protein kinase n=1 Tax=Elsinoe ampelina TaxID=302913 RepID=A0A6A6GF99_9PEZI|nr:hypothetical protein BDZ85DRAFT_260381 [Elsinoe ampelina]
MAPRRTYGKRPKAFPVRTLHDSPFKAEQEAQIDNLANDFLGLEVKHTTDVALDRKSRHALQPISRNERSNKAPDGGFKKNGFEIGQTQTVPSCRKTGKKSAGKLQPKVEAAPLEESHETTVKVTDHLDIPVQSSPQPNTPGDPTEASSGVSPHSSLPTDLHDHLLPLLPFCNNPLTPLSTFSATLTPHFTISKLAEASFSQVFLLSSPTLSSTHRSVLKLIPLLPSSTSIPVKPSRSAKQLLSLSSSPSAVATETRLLAHLTNIPGFTAYRALHLLSGRPGSAFTKACRTWNAQQKAQGKEGSYLPDPGRKGNYPDSQIWAVIEMSDAGLDLERWLEAPPSPPSLPSSPDPSTPDKPPQPPLHPYGIAAIFDIFWQIVLAAGKGEVSSQWESRDLHCGNICVRQRRPLGSLTPREAMARRLASSARSSSSSSSETSRRKLGLTGLEVTIIDYTISRAEVVNVNGEKEVAYIDLDEDEGLFEGDEEVEYQYAIYRHMRAAVVAGDPLAGEEEVRRGLQGKEWLMGQRWRGFRAETNVVWLFYVLGKLLEKYQWGCERGCEKDGEGRALLEARERGMEDVMKQVRELLKLENWKVSGIRSAGDLIGVALKEGWLEFEDVVGLIGEERERKKSKKVRSRTKAAGKA